MNQSIKEAVYQNGSKDHVEFVASYSGMSKIEKDVFQMLHDGETDVYIQIKLGLTRKSYQKIEDQVRRKTLTVVMTAIDQMMRHN